MGGRGGRKGGSLLGGGGRKEEVHCFWSLPGVGGVS